MTDTIEARLARIEADLAIRQLVARYAFDIDDRNLDAVEALFTEDAIVRSGDGVMMAAGRDALIAQYRGRFKALGAGMHFMHDHDIRLLSETTATGRVSGHAELWRNNQMMIVGLRYNDRYRKESDGWKFAEREILYLYYVPLADYPGILGKTDRNLAYGKATPADFPEALPSWIAYNNS